MEARLHAQPKAAPTLSFTPVRGGVLQRKCACGGSAGLTGDCEDCNKQNLSLQRATRNLELETRNSSDVSQVVHEVLRSPGQPLDAETRAFMERRFGHDFSRVSIYASSPNQVQTSGAVSVPGDPHEQQADHVANQVVDAEEVSASEPSASSQHRGVWALRSGYDFSQVRIHADSYAAKSADAVNALAYTTGRHIVFGDGQYAPQTNAGRLLLAHELAHVAQQSAQAQPLIQRQSKGPATQVGPVSGEGGLVYDSTFKRMSVIIGPDDTLRFLAKKLLPLWTKATPFTPEGASAPLPLTPLTEEQLGKGLLVYNQHYLAVPRMTEWKVGLRFPLPIEVNQETGEQILNSDLIASLASSFDAAWTPLLAQKPSALSKPTADELKESVKDFLDSTSTPLARGIHLSTRALTNALEAAPFTKEAFSQLGSDAFDTALAFMDSIVIHQFDVLASQPSGVEIIDALRAALSKSPATLGAEQQASLARANNLLNKPGAFSAETAETVKQIYITDVPGCHCMSAVYKGLEGLFSKEVSQSISKQVGTDAAAVMKRTGIDTNHMDRIMETVRARGKAGPMTVLTYNSNTTTWEPDPETTILGMTHPTIAGWYFFGFSVHGAYHSVILAVDKTDPGNPQIYWMDQFSRGFTKNVTGMLSDQMKALTPDYGFSPSKVWQIIPAADTLIELH